MGKGIIAFLCLAIGFVSCKNKTEFVINGAVKNKGEQQKIYLYASNNMGQMAPIDSTFFNENQEFTLKYKSETPDFFQLVIGNKSYMLIASNGDEIDFKTDLRDNSGAYQVEGSEEAEKITAYNKITTTFTSKTGAMAEQYSKMIGSNPGLKDSLIAEYTAKSQEIAKPYLKDSYDFIEANKKSLTAFFAANVMMGVNATAYESQLIAYSKEAKANFPNNPAVKAFAQQMEMASKTAIGQLAPEVSAETPEGKIIKLSDFKGKYVLLDFWASWCAPCRQENPNIVKVYQQFKGKNFTVLGFSLDDDKGKWQQAIKADNLNWTHISEMKQWDSENARLYNVNAIPASFLINPEGKIIAKNLRGEELEAFLQKTL